MCNQREVVHTVPNDSSKERNCSYTSCSACALKLLGPHIVETHAMYTLYSLVMSWPPTQPHLSFNTVCHTQLVFAIKPVHTAVSLVTRTQLTKS